MTLQEEHTLIIRFMASLTPAQMKAMHEEHWPNGQQPEGYDFHGSTLAAAKKHFGIEDELSGD